MEKNFFFAPLSKGLGATRRAAMLLLVMLLTTATAWAWSGSGTSADPYLINSASDLAQLATDVNGGESYNNMYFKQTANITLTSAWTPIGTDSSHPFKGHYDGGGYQITGLNVTTNGQYAGLFGYIVGGQYQGSVTTTMIANVNNVVLVNPTITVTATSSAQYAGAVVGYAGTCTGVSYNTIIGGTVSYTGIKNYNTNNSYAGGVVGYYSSVHFSLLTYNKVSGITVSGGGISGGVTGYAQYSYHILGNVVDANVSSAEFDLHTDIHTYGYRQGVVVGYCYMVSGSPSNPSNVNYYHSVNGLTAYGANASYHSFNPVADGGYNAQIYTITTSDNLTVSDGATATIGTKSYFAAGATATLSTDDSHIFKDSPTVSGTGASVGSVAANKKSATVTVGTADVTVSATLLSLTGSCGDNATWAVTDTNSDGTYETLTINGTGAITSSPWATDFAATIERVNILSADLTISGNPFSMLGTGALIVVPTPAYAVSYSSAAYASKLRVALGSYLFTVTDEGGTAAYEIANETDLRNLSAAVDQNHQGCNGLTFCQTAPITLNGPFTPIGYYNGSSDKQYFYGTYDGGGYTISGLSVSSPQVYTGLFGAVRNGGMVKNVRLISPSVTCNFYGSCVGALIGLADQCTIENCSVVSPIVSATASSYANNVGALVGDLSEANVQNCFVVSPTLSAAGSTKVGAICGYAYSASEQLYCTLTNVYYYNSSLEAIGQHDNSMHSHVTKVARTRKVTLGDNVTVSPAASDPANGFVYNNESYYREGLELTLGNTLGEAPEYYALNYATTAGTINGSTLTVGNADATVSAAIRSDGQPHSITYMKADGTTGQADAIALDGYETAIEDFGSYCVHLADGTYYVGHDISYDYKIIPDGDITLILGNGKTMTLASNVSGIQGGSIDLTIYGQSLDPVTAGILRYDGTSNLGIFVGDYTQHSGNVSLICSDYTGVKALLANTVTLNGGKLTITANSINAKAINASMTVITGGQLDATATGTNAVGINAYNGNATITLGWNKPTDRITASSYYGTVAVADGQSLYNGSEVLSGTITDMSKLDGKTLRPYKTITLADAADNSSAIREWNGSVAEVQLTGRTLYKDGDWNTLCLPFDVSTTSGPLAGDNVVAMTLNTSESNLTGSTLTLNFKAAETIPAGTPFIIKWGEQEGKTGYLGTIIENPVFTGVTIDNTDRSVTSSDGYVTFKGTYSPIVWDTENKSILFVGTNNTLYWPTAGGHVNACRAYFDLGSASAREFVMNFEEGNSETTSLPQPLQKEGSQADAWYTLDGRKLNGKPTTKGLYIHNGKKVIIK